jgi:hypothetical protein
MESQLNWTQRRILTPLSLIALGSVAVLVVSDVIPGILPAVAHNFLGALGLTLIALGYIAYQTIRHPGSTELLKSFLLSIAFLLWAAKEVWPAKPDATVLNDMAIALFAFYVFAVIVGRPSSSNDE